MIEKRQVLLFGATGNMGGATARALLERGWSVRAVTRKPRSVKAQALAALGAEVVQADMDDPPSLAAAFDGIRHVFSVQNFYKSGIEAEVRQGLAVADAAAAAGVAHIVYGSAGTGEAGTGVPHFDSKLEVEAHMRRLDLPLTIVRPTPFMELLADMQFGPPLITWGAEPRVLGWHRPKPWIAVRDIGIAVANIFANRDRWVGREVDLAGDVKTLAECRAIFKEVDGRKPLRIPLPFWILRRMGAEELLVMWEWLAELSDAMGRKGLWQMVEETRELCPDLLEVESWLRRLRAGRLEMAPLHPSAPAPAEG
ncbi:MAG: NmrA/HSCARG family protein [Candidatus Promineifilaceae bacterium]|nr:NmrA/HSCARG family protein [Candidatus Promineifilaceae bacterium]